MKQFKTIALMFMCAGFLSACAEAQYASHVMKQIPMPGDKGKSAGYYKVGKPYKIAGKKYYPDERFRHSETGTASWYGPKFHGKQTANGEIFNKYELTAAHRTLQMPSIIRVTNLGNGRSLILRVNDRGPYAHNRVLDVSERAAELLGFKGQGTAKVRIDVLEGPSREVAAMAKERIDTTGYEVALNRNKTHLNKPASYAYNNDDNVKVASFQAKKTSPVNSYKPRETPQPVAKPQYEPITTVEMQSIATPPTPPPQQKPPHSSLEVASLTPASGTPTPAPIAKPQNFYVQAGAFREEQNALNFSKSLATHGNSRVYLSQSNGTPTFRVKLGPYTSNEAAKIALNSLQSSGKSGIVIAE